MRKIKERYSLVLLLTILSLTLSGCGMKETTQSKSEKTDWSITVSYAYSGLPNVAFSGDRTLYTEQEIIHIRDIKTDTSTVLCTYPNCTHDSQLAMQGKSNCEAAVPSNAFGSIAAIGLHSDTVFQFYTSSNNAYETMLYISHVGQRGRKKVATLPYVVVTNYMYFQNNKLYFTAQRNDENEDGTKTVLTRFFLLEMDLDTYEITELDELSSESYIQIVRLDYSDGVLAYESCQRDKDDSDKTLCEIYFYDTQTKEKSKFEGGSFYSTPNYIDYRYYLGYRNGCIYAASEATDKIQTIDVATGEENTIVSVEKGKRIYKCNMNYDVGISYTITNEETKENWESKDKKEYVYCFADNMSYPVAETYQRALGILMITKDGVCQQQEENDGYSLQWLPFDEYIDKSK